VNLADLPPKMRASPGTGPATSGAAGCPAPAGGPARNHPSVPGRFRCVTCGALHRTYTAAQRHADTEHHPRLELIL
jgi:hypothetical protein